MVRQPPDDVAGDISALAQPASTRIEFEWTTATTSRSFDFATFYGKGCDEVVLATQRAIEWQMASRKLRTSTIAAACNVGLRHFLDFCAVTASRLAKPIGLCDVRLGFIEEYIGHLAGRGASTYGSQSSAYAGTKRVLSVLCARRLLPPAHEIFPRNPYPGCERTFKGKSPLTESERERLAKGLKAELIDVFKGGATKLSESDRLVVLFLAICLRVGRNTTPMLELPRQPIEPHPLRENLRLLRTVKHRAGGVQLAPVSLDVVVLLDKARELSEPCVEEAPSRWRERLWLFRRQKCGRHASQVSALTFQTLGQGTRRFIARQGVLGDDGQPLDLNTSRLRKTLENRLWRLSGGDPYAVARLIGHTVRISMSRYLVPTPEMERNHKFVGEALVARWSNPGQEDRAIIGLKAENTPVGRCRDPYEGERAPRTGKACIDFLSCFHCTSYVIVEDEKDLWRLYSFYWFLVRERGRVGAGRWAKAYGWIVRMIDDQVTAKFDKSLVAAIRMRAKDDPHPFWRNPETLEAARRV